MNVASALALLRSLRQDPSRDTFWNDYSALLRFLAQAEQCLLIRPGSEHSLQVLGGDPAETDWLLEQARDITAGRRRRMEGQGFASLQCSDPQGRMRLAVAVQLMADPLLIAVFDIPARESARLSELLLRVHLVADLAEMRAGAAGLPTAAGDHAETTLHRQTDLLDTLELMAGVMGEAHFGAAVLTLVNGLASRLGSSQVALGWFAGGYVRVEAISHVSRFDHKTEHTRLLESACEEAFDQERSLVYPDDRDSGHVLLAHRQLHQTMGQARILSLPLRSGEKPYQAVLLIAEQDVPVSATRLRAVQVGLGLLMPWLEERRAQDRWWGARLFGWGGEKLGRLLGPEYPWQKLTALVVLGGLLYICLASQPFRLEAAAEMVTDQTRQIGAPFDGYVDQAYVTTGDQVDAGTMLARLDVNDLILQEAEIRAEMRRLVADADKARARNSLVDVEIALARSAQAQARLERTLQRRSQAEIRAPFDGVIVEGERKDLLGAPVRKGDPLFRLARIEGLYGQLQLPERLIRFLDTGATGELALLAQPDQRTPFRVTRVVPMAQVKGQEGNHFIVKAALEQVPERWWRPGMNGVAKIDAGRRPIIWLWTYRLMDALRMRLWW